jgi:hypothetical protein
LFACDCSHLVTDTVTKRLRKSSPRLQQVKQGFRQFRQKPPVAVILLFIRLQPGDCAAVSRSRPLVIGKLFLDAGSRCCENLRLVHALGAQSVFMLPTTV